MRFVSFALSLCLLACGSDPPGRPPDAPAAPPDALPDAPGRPASCPTLCPPNVGRCPGPYDQMIPECQSACYWGTCCELIDGAWGTITLDCRYPPDAGVDDAGVDAAR